MSLTVRVSQTEAGRGLPLPTYQSEGSAGLDLLAALAADAELVLEPHARELIATGIVLEIPQGFEAQIRPRSGLALRYGVSVLNAPGTIDSDYRGEVGVILVNHGSEPFRVRRGDRIAQMVIQKVHRLQPRLVDDLTETLRGDGGFGHTGTGSPADS